jgi:hypothetical protein
LTTVIEYVLLSANLIAYATAVIALLRRNRRSPNNSTLEQAYGILDDALAKSFPDMKEGYTWKEAIIKLKSAKPRITQIDWTDLENTTRRYESFRYGGVDYGDADASTVLRLAQTLQRRKNIDI